MSKPIYCKQNPYTVYSLWGELVGTTTANNFNMAVTIDNETYNVITKDWFENIIKAKYYDRLYYSPQNSVELAAADFVVDFVNWKNQTISNWGRIVRALVAEYNPVENYASHEEISTEYGHTIETTHGHVVELAHGHEVELVHGHEVEITHGLQTDVEYGRTETATNEPDGATITTTKSVYGVNSSTAVPSDVDATVKTGKDVDTTAYTGTDTTTNSGTDTTTNSGTDTTTNSGTDTTTNSGTDTDTHSGTDTITTDKSGNIGVMTAAQMIKEELAIRMYNVTERSILAFMNAYTIY